MHLTHKNIQHCFLKQFHTNLVDNIDVERSRDGGVSIRTRDRQRQRNRLVIEVYRRLCNGGTDPHLEL